MNAPHRSVRFRLAPPALGYDVEVCLRRAGERWVAEATVDGASRTGLGGTPRGALVGALSSLSDTDVRVLLADTMLLRPSVEVLALAAGGPV